MVLVYTEFESERLRYILDLMLKELLGVQYSIVHELSTEQEQVAVIDYRPLPEFGLRINAGSLLKESETRPVEVAGRENGDQFEILLDGSEQFDPLAAAFYLTSRYEEFMPYEPDAHERFSADASCLKRLGVLERPLVNEWAVQIRDRLLELNPELKFNPRKFEYLSTIDIDQAWKYKHKGFPRTLGGFLGDLASLRTAKLYERCAVLLGFIQDPFDNYELQHAWHEEFDSKVQYFLQVGRRGKFDKNQNAGNKAFQRLIRDLDDAAHVGIHPSYQSNYHKSLLKAERGSLENILGRKVTRSRQHFLMHKMPDTYLNLLEIGVTRDYTMGYSTDLGFRGGIAAPFHFYDLSREEYTDLLLIPFCFMDITPLHYMGKTVDEAKEVASELIDKVKAVGGLFCTLWHNESLSDSERWNGWRPLYRHILKEVSA